MELNERVYNIFLRDPKTLKEYAKEIGIHEQLLSKFLENKEYPLQFKNRLIIERWVLEKEKEID